MQYKAALAIIGAIQGTSRDKIYQELGLESHRSRGWYQAHFRRRAEIERARTFFSSTA